MSSTDLPSSLTGSDDPDLVTLSCPECAETFTGKPSGPNSAPMRRGTHLWVKHKIKGAGRERRRPDDDTLNSSAPLAAVISIGAAAGNSKSAPKAEEIAAALGRALVLTTVAGGTYIAETDPSIPDDEAGEKIRDGLVEYLAMDQKPAEAVFRPVGRAFADTKINARYGRAVVDNVDVIGSLAELGTLGFHWRKVLRMRAHGGILANQSELQQQLAAGALPNVGGTVVAGAPAPQATVPALAQEFQPEVHPSGLLHSPGPVHGQVLSAADVEALQRRNGGN